MFKYCLNNSTVCLITLSTLVFIFCHQSSVLLSVSSVIKANAKEEQPKHCVYGKPTFKQCPQSNEELVQGLVHAGNKRHVVTPIQSTCFLILHGCDNRSFSAVKIAQIIEVYKVAATPSENIPNILPILDQIGLSVEG